MLSYATHSTNQQPANSLTILHYTRIDSIYTLFLNPSLSPNAEQTMCAIAM